jgi:hypothetical protein
MLPPTGPAFELPPAEAKRQKARGTLRTTGIVVGCIVVAGFILAPIVGPVFNAQRAKANDLNAKADVATLGKGIAIYFVDNDGPPPDITVIDGKYHLDAPPSSYQENDTPVSPGVRFGGVEGTGYTDWCVWVTHPDGEYKVFKYSAQRGLEQGRC